MGLGAWTRSLLGGDSSQRSDVSLAEQPNAQQCRIDLAQYEWLLQIYVHAGGLTDQQARDMLCHLDPSTFQGAMVCRDSGTPGAPQLSAPETAQTTDGATVPDAVHRGTHATNRSYMLDWDSRPNTLTPEAADGTDAQSTMREVFRAHRDQQIRAIFGDAANYDNVRTAIELAQAAGRTDTADALSAALFRANQYAVVESLNTEDSARYRAGGGDTFCNIYAHDVVTALGGYLPRMWWYDPVIRRIQAGARTVTNQQYREMQAAGEDMTNVIQPDYGVTIRELNANSLNAWMREWGQYYGWSDAGSAAAAQEQANGGRIVIGLATGTGHGHVTVVLGEDGEHRAHRDAAGVVDVPLQSQAGSSNFKYSDPDQRSGQSSWWNNASHSNGGFWVFNGATRSPIVTPESLGASR